MLKVYVSAAGGVYAARMSALGQKRRTAPCPSHDRCRVQSGTKTPESRSRFIDFSLTQRPVQNGTESSNPRYARKTVEGADGPKAAIVYLSREVTD